MGHRTKLVKHLGGSLRINLITVSSQQGDEVYDNHTSQNCTPIPKLHFCSGCLAYTRQHWLYLPKAFWAQQHTFRCLFIKEPKVY